MHVLTGRPEGVMVSFLLMYLTRCTCKILCRQGCAQLSSRHDAATRERLKWWTSSEARCAAQRFEQILQETLLLAYPHLHIFSSRKSCIAQLRVDTCDEVFLAQALAFLLFRVLSLQLVWVDVRSPNQPFQGPSPWDRG